MKKVFLMLPIMFGSLNAQAEEVSKNNASLSFYQKSILIVEKYQASFSTYIDEGSDYLDSYWEEDTVDIIEEEEKKEENIVDKFNNASFGIFKLGTSYSTKEGLKSQVKLKLKLDLPNTKKNVKVFFDVNDNSFESLSDKTNIVQQNVNDDKLTSGLSYEKEGKRWDRNYKIGVKIDTPLDTFVKAEFRRKKEFTDNLSLLFEQEAFWYKSEGLGTASKFYFHYDLDNSSDFLQASYTFQYLKDEGWEMYSNYSYFQEFDNKNSLKYEIGGIKEIENSTDNVRYWTNVQWKHQLHKDWLFLKVIPEVSFSEEYNYSAEYKLLVQLEMFFGNEKGLRKGIRKYKYR